MDVGTRSVYVVAKVISIQEKYSYPCCIRCRRRIRTLDDEQTFWCMKCKKQYDRDHIQYRYRVNMTVSDRSQVAEVTVFGSCLQAFFGATATQFCRFATSLCLESENLPIVAEKLIHQSMEQCFVGSMVKLGFHVLPPYRTSSQISRSSPVHLKNIVSRLPFLDCTVQEQGHPMQPRTGASLPVLTACLISRCPNVEEGPSVLQILHGYLQEFRNHTEHLTPTCSVSSGLHQAANSINIKSHSSVCSQRLRLSSLRPKSTPCSFALTSSQSCALWGHSLLVSPLILSSESECSSSAGISSPSSLGSSILGVADKGLPAELTTYTGCLESFSTSHPSLSCNGSICTEANTEDESLLLTKTSTWQNNSILTSQDTRQQSKKTCTSLQADIKLTPLNQTNYEKSFNVNLDECHWTQFADFPSSENLSEFLADMSLEDTEHIVGDQNGNISKCQKSCTTRCSKSTDVRRKSLTVCDHVTFLEENEFSNFTDFPSSEDLEAFLADIELESSDFDSSPTSSTIPTCKAEVISFPCDQEDRQARTSFLQKSDLYEFHADNRTIPKACVGKFNGDVQQTFNPKEVVREETMHTYPGTMNKPNFSEHEGQDSCYESQSYHDGPSSDSRKQSLPSCFARKREDPTDYMYMPGNSTAGLASREMGSLSEGSYWEISALGSESSTKGCKESSRQGELEGSMIELPNNTSLLDDGHHFAKDESNFCESSSQGNAKKCITRGDHTNWSDSDDELSSAIDTCTPVLFPEMCGEEQFLEEPSSTPGLFSKSFEASITSSRSLNWQNSIELFSKSRSSLFPSPLQSQTYFTRGCDERLCAADDNSHSIPSGGIRCAGNIVNESKFDQCCKRFGNHSTPLIGSPRKQVVSSRFSENNGSEASDKHSKRRTIAKSARTTKIRASQTAMSELRCLRQCAGRYISCGKNVVRNTPVGHSTRSSVGTNDYVTPGKTESSDGGFLITETPMLFSFSSSCASSSGVDRRKFSDSCKSCVVVLEDSLLSASLMDCSYLK